MDRVWAEESKTEFSGKKDGEEREKLLDLIDPEDYDEGDPLYLADLQYSNELGLVSPWKRKQEIC